MSILYTNAIISVRSGKVLTLDRVRRMIVAPDAPSSAKILFECGYDELLLTEKPDREDLIIAAEMKRTVETLKELCPSPLLLDILLSKFDYHNAAAVYNHMRSDTDIKNLPTDSIYPFGLVGFEKVKNAVAKRDYAVLPEPMREALLGFNKDNPSAFGVELGLVRAMYADILPKVRKLGNSGIKEYFRVEVDFANMLSFAKMRLYGKMEKSPFIEGGKATESQVNSIMSKNPGAVKAGFASLPYSDVTYALAEGLESLDLAPFERASANYLIGQSKKGSDDSFSLNPLFSWWVEKWEELRTVKTILVGKKLGMTREELFAELGLGK